MHPRHLQISEFDYTLPEKRIPSHPLPDRDASKLLVFRRGKIVDAHFLELGQFLGEEVILIGNNTRVIPARLFFKKATGASIEIFCLEPISKSHQDAMIEKGKSTWLCMVGGAKKWKRDEVLSVQVTAGTNDIALEAIKVGKNDDQFTIEFRWNHDQVSFSEILDAAGQLPLPPYFNRQAEEEDYLRYQTVFARMNGSVAAPTAGLHFTEPLLQSLESKGIRKLELTLHVGAGTFKPVSAENMEGHAMHSEKFSVSLTLLEYLIAHPSKKIVTIGTTTTRALESLYWLGAKWMSGEDKPSGVGQWDPYELKSDIPPLEALQFLYDSANQLGLSEIQTETSVMIAPGYRFQFIHGIITNFHMPKSTLLLLVAAITGQNEVSGEHHWRMIYEHALKNNYRFLSYGDSSLLFVNPENQSR
ncbi:MAG: S-adenosylmethionine:tRNA ribosyltransferase-isomerase [Flavobacteriales bacterium]